MRAGVDFAGWRNIGVGNHVGRMNIVARNDIAGERDERLDLCLGIGSPATIDDLDAD